MLPQVNSLRKKKVKIENKTYEIIPWTNRQIIGFESMKDSLDKKDSKYRRDLEKLKLDELVLPNIEPKGKLSIFQFRLLFIELYKLSKGTEIDFQFACKECSGEKPVYSSGIFKLDDIKYNQLTSKIIKTDKYIFNLKNSSYDIMNDESEDKPVKYIISYIKSIIDIESEETIEGFTLDELLSWFMDELDSDTYKSFMTQFKDIQPDMQIEGTYICEFCGTDNFIQFKDIPDFSLCW